MLLKIIDDLRTLVFEEKFKMIYENRKLDIVNYQAIPVFNSKEIQVKYIDGIISITGSNLVISRLLKEELLITGDIKKIEYRTFNE